MVSPGTVSKTLPLLISEDAIGRDATGTIATISRRRVLERWMLDYRVLVSNRDVRYYIAPRSVDKAIAVPSTRTDVAFTGLQGARAYLPSDVNLLVPPTQVVCYAEDIDDLAKRVGLQEVDAPSANVILIKPHDPTLLSRVSRIDGMPVAPLPLVLADLLTLPGRYPQQAKALVDALAKTDPAWRSS